MPRRSVEVLLRLPMKIVPFREPPLFRALGLVQLKGSPKNHLCNAVFKQLVKVCSPDETTPSSGEETARTALLDDDELRRALQTAAPSSAAE